MSTGRRLAMIRHARDLSLRQLAAIVHLHKSTLGNWERGRGNVSATRLRQLAQALDCGASDLLDPPGAPIPPPRRREGR